MTETKAPKSVNPKSVKGGGEGVAPRSRFRIVSEFRRNDDACREAVGILVDYMLSKQAAGSSAAAAA